MVMQFDVIVVGAGLVGRLFAVGLAKNGLRVASIDRDDASSMLDATLDGRTTAISLGSQKIFARLGLWNAIAPYAQPIDYIRVVDDGSPWTLDYDAKDISHEPMGYIVENTYIRSSLYQVTPDTLTVFAPEGVESVVRADDGVTVTLQSNQVLRAPLIVAADGRYSALRAQTNICVQTKDYDQKAFVVHILHDKPHNNTAFEVFFKDGPLAVLPLTNDPITHAHRSGLVWCKPRDFDWGGYNDDELSALFKTCFPYYGDVTFQPKRWHYPLSYTKVNSMIDNRIALIGDAGHVMHPIAGQGVNLGWRDAIVLIENLSAAKAQGIDLGNPFLLKQYEKQRKYDRLGLLWATDGINCLYQSQLPPVRFARNAAFAVLNYIKPFKRAVMRRAMGMI